jgi:hypothetical protein
MLAGRNLRGMVAPMSSLVGGRPHPKLLLFSAALLMTAGFVLLRLARPALYQAIIQEDAALEWLQAALYAGSAALSLPRLPFPGQPMARPIGSGIPLRDAGGIELGPAAVSSWQRPGLFPTP